MKKAFIAMMVCAALVSCNNKQDKAEDRDNDDIEATEEENDDAEAEAEDEDLEISEAVQEAADEDGLTPDMQVSRPLLIDFNATWCGPCQKFKPVFHGVAAKLAGSADFVSVDADECPNTVQAFGVESLPTLYVILPDGTTKQFVGLNDFMMTEESFAEYVNSLL